MYIVHARFGLVWVCLPCTFALFPLVLWQQRILLVVHFIYRFIKLWTFLETSVFVYIGSCTYFSHSSVLPSSLIYKHSLCVDATTSIWRMCAPFECSACFFFSVRFGGYTMPVEYRANFTLKCHGFSFVELCMKTFVETMQKMCEGINGMSKM